MINFAFCIDRNYSQHFCVSLVSLVQYHSNFTLWLIHSGLEKQAREFVDTLCKSYQLVFHEIEVGKELFNDFKLTRGISKASFYRLLLPELIPRKVERLIYLDSDIVVNGDLSALFNLPLDGKYLAAVENGGYKGQELPL